MGSKNDHTSHVPGLQKSEVEDKEMHITISEEMARDQKFNSHAAAIRSMSNEQYQELKQILSSDPDINTHQKQHTIMALESIRTGELYVEENDHHDN